MAERTESVRQRGLEKQSHRRRVTTRTCRAGLVPPAQGRCAFGGKTLGCLGYFVERTNFLLTAGLDFDHFNEKKPGNLGKVHFREEQN